MDSAPKSLADVLASSPPSDKLFATVPATMQDQGRVAGFEALRDMLLSNWRELAAEFDIPLQQLLKLVLETDRHALFAQLSEEKMGDADKSKQSKHKWFQQYLEGEVDLSTSPLVNEGKGETTGGPDQDVQG